MPQTIVEKIMSQHAGKNLKAGDYAICSVDFCFGQDGTSSLIIDRIREFGIKNLKNGSRFCMVIDHSVPSPNSRISDVHEKMRDFARQKKFSLYDIGCGVCHQIIPEHGHILPGDLVLGADSHTCSYGALGAFASGVGSTDLAVSLATGKNWFRVPETIRVVLKGRLPAGVFAKDIILYLIKDFTCAGATYKSVEFTGPLAENLDVEERLTISNMVVEMGAKCGIFEPNETVLRWLKPRIKRKRTMRIVRADRDAHYCIQRVYDLSNLSPQVARPHNVDNVVEVTRLKGVRIQEAFLGTCTNGRLKDLEIAAFLLKGKRVHPRVKFIIAPASREIYIEALKRGLMQTFVEAGASVLAPGCGPCVGTHGGIPADGETVLSTANRNFQGRMGNPKAFIYLASPATVVVSAIKGVITDPRMYF